jgi:hypothetical protein
MEDKLINKMISHHMKKFANNSQILKHKSFTNDHKTNVTTASISRDTSDAQLKNENSGQSVQSHRVKPANKSRLYISRSSERVEKIKTENKSKEKFSKKNIQAATNQLKKIQIVKKPMFDNKPDIRIQKSNVLNNNKSYDSKAVLKEMNTNVTNKSEAIINNKKEKNHHTNKTTTSCIVFDRNSMKIDRNYRKSIQIVNEGRNDFVIGANTVIIINKFLIDIKLLRKEI